MPNTYYIYIITNKRKSVLYIGVTSNLLGRAIQHKIKFFKGFTRKYNVDILVYYEEYDDIYQAIAREKQLKRWRRDKKEALIRKQNPTWLNLSKGWF